MSVLRRYLENVVKIEGNFRSWLLRLFFSVYFVHDVSETFGFFSCGNPVFRECVNGVPCRAKFAVDKYFVCEATFERAFFQHGRFNLD